MMLTLQKQLIRGLVRSGYRRDPRATSRRYEVFIDHVRGEGRRIYVGRLGALRGGPSVATSIPLNGLKALMLAAGLSDREEAR